MGRKTFKTAVLIVTTGVVLASLGISNPSRNNSNVRNPVGSRPTSPQSSVSSGLYRSPNPFNEGGNNVITGNVGGGKHFRGSVPYRSQSDFYDNLGSTSLDPFLRRSQRSSLDNYYGHSSGLTPFYSPSGTVTRSREGSESPLRLPSTRLNSRADPGEYTSDNYDSRMPETGNRKMQSTLGISPDGDYRLRSPAVEDYSKRTNEQGEAENWGISEGQKERYRGYREVSEDRRETVKSDKETQQQTQQEAEKQLTDSQQDWKQQQQQDEQADVYQQMLDRLEELRERTRKIKEDIPADRQEEENDEESKSTKETRTEQSESQQQSVSIPGSGGTKALEDMTLEEINAEAEGILGEHKSFSSYSDSRFNRYMSLAEQRLAKGKFYLAADSYSMAISYKKTNPLPYAGKCHALFAAGEYMSSALFLSRTLEMFPEYPLFDVDLVEMLGGRDIIETRIADIKDWIRVAPGDVPELHFLLAYIYHQIDRNQAAIEQIEKARELEPDNENIQVLYDVINSTEGKDKS